MFSGFQQTVDATVEPWTTEEVKTFLGVDFPEHDALLGAMISGARVHAETYLRRALISQTFVATFDAITADGVVIPRPPLISVTSLKYATDEAVPPTQSTAAATDYVFDVRREPAVLYLTGSKPATLQLRDGTWELTYVAGYGSTAADVPAAIRSAILLIVGNLYEHRMNEANEDVKIPAQARALLAPFVIPNE